MSTIALKPADIRHEIRGQEDVYNGIDKLLFGIKKITNIDNGRHYRMCFICSKIQKYITRKDQYPKKEQYYEDKIDMRLRELVELLHDHITDHGPTEHNFYEFLLEAWGILNQEVRFSKDPYNRFLKIAFEEHAKYRATEKGELTAASLIDFCAHLDEYTEAAVKQIVPDLYHLFLGPQHPEVQLLFATKGKQENKISKETVKAEIRERMVQAVVSLFDETVAPTDRLSLKEALKQTSALLKEHPEHVKASIAALESASASHECLKTVGMHLLNARSALGKRASYTFKDLVSKGEVNMGYQHPFVTDLRFYKNMQATLEATLEHAGELRAKVVESMIQDRAQTSRQIEFMQPEIDIFLKECEKLRTQLQNYPSTILDDAFDCTLISLRLGIETELLRQEIARLADPRKEQRLEELTPQVREKQATSLERRVQASEYRLLKAQLTHREGRIGEYEALRAKVVRLGKQIFEKAGQFETLFSTYKVQVSKELSNVESQRYLLSELQLSKLYDKHILK